MAICWWIIVASWLCLPRYADSDSDENPVVVLVVVVVTVIIILDITFVQGIYNYIPETNHVSRVYSVTAVLYLKFVLHVMLFHLWNLFCTFTLALSIVCKHCTIWLFFCIPLILCFPGMLLRYCLSDFEMVPFATVITGITFAFTFHVCWISVMRSSYFKIFSASIIAKHQHMHFTFNSILV